jgi:hypothetical protein
MSWLGMALFRLLQQELSAMVYKFRTGHGVKGVSAQDVGECLETLKARGETWTPADVVEEARPETAPLHPAFEWDDSIAAEKYREDQARHVITSVQLVENEGTPEEKRSLACLSIADPFDPLGPQYTFTRDALAKVDLRARIIARERALLDAWTARNRHIEELAAEVEAIETARAARAAQAAAARPQRPRRGARQPAAATV